jgi:hypothetical protein
VKVLRGSSEMAHILCLSASGQTAGADLFDESSPEVFLLEGEDIAVSALDEVRRMWVKIAR